MPFQLLPTVSVHPTEELLEEYSFGRVCEPDLTPLEEHLLVCAPCQIRLEELDDYTALMKAAARAWEQDRRAFRSNPLRWLTPSTKLAFPKMPGAHFTRAGILPACALLAGIFLTTWVGITTTVSSNVWHSPRLATTVKLTAMRGGDGGGGQSGGLSQAPSGRPLDLAVDGANLPPAPGYRLDLVNQSGRSIWSGAAVVTGTKLSAHLASGLPRGVYWVRLYSSNGDFLREFGMRLQ